MDTDTHGSGMALPAQLAAILLVAGICGGIANLVFPQRIAWVEDWSRHIEAQAYEMGITLISLNGTRQMVEKGEALIFDARPAVDYEAGHLPDALSLPYEEADRRLMAFEAILSSEQPMLTYCAGTDCDEALLLTDMLQKQGFTNIVMFAGGWEEWSATKTGASP